MKFILPKIIITTEKWKWNEQYQVYVSTLGNIKDINKKVIPQKINASGYMIVKTKSGYKNVHRIVLSTFKPIENEDNMTVDHINHNKRENKLRNLEWVTFEVNQMRAVEDYIQPEPVQDTVINGPVVKISSVQEGVNWVIDTQGITGNNGIPAYTKNISKKINKAIRNKTKYCGKYWRLEQ